MFIPAVVVSVPAPVISSPVGLYLYCILYSVFGILNFGFKEFEGARRLLRNHPRWSFAKFQGNQPLRATLIPWGAWAHILGLVRGMVIHGEID